MITKAEIEIVERVLKLDLEIPNYQRPYTWSDASASRLFNDIYEAYSDKVEEYRIGNVILYKNNESNKLEIVDGQQRLTTLLLILKCLNSEISECSFPLLSNKYGNLSCNSLKNNYNIISRLISKIDVKNKTVFFEYVLKHCTMVEIIIEDNLQQAFTIFDSQNNRGKTLSPHDILKAYHLREMDNNDGERENKEIIMKFEEIDEKNKYELEELFKYNLYPIIQWANKNSGNDFGLARIEVFKGIKNNKRKNYQFGNFLYYNAVANYEPSKNEEIYYERFNHFLLTQPVIAGKWFFKYVIYYNELKKRVEKLIKRFVKKSEIIKDKNNNIIENLLYMFDGKGGMYIYNLFLNVTMLFIDRFDENELDDNRFKLMFQWSYFKRIVSYSVSWDGVNKYVIKDASENLFEIINKSAVPNSIDNCFIRLKEDDIDERYKDKCYDGFRNMFDYNEVD